MNIKMFIETNDHSVATSKLCEDRECIYDEKDWGKYIYNREYFEGGSYYGTYSGYIWCPELSIPMAKSIIDVLALTDKDTVLDFGCAKGFLVKALRLENIDVWGCDISEYAINNIDNDVKEFCRLNSIDDVVPFDFRFDWIIAKDVFEHLSEERLDDVLTKMYKKTDKLFIIVPLGKNGKFIIPFANNIYHLLARDKQWWINKLIHNRWELIRFEHYIKDIREKWKCYNEGYGYFICKKTQ